jgi:hypothetical protein
MDVVCAKHAGYGSAAVEYAIGNNFRGALGACVVLVVATNTSSSEDLAIAGVDSLDEWLLVRMRAVSCESLLMVSESCDMEDEYV